MVKRGSGRRRKRRGGDVRERLEGLAAAHVLPFFECV